jgi:glycogen synthase
MAEIEWIESLQYKPDNFVFTFNYLKDIPENKRELLKLYNYVTTTSETYFESIKNELNIDNFYGITNGLLTEIFSPSKGLLLTSSYGANSLKGKEKCKKTFLKLHNVKGNPCIYLVAGLRPEPNLKEIIDIIPLIREQNGLLVIATKSNIFYEIELDKFKKKDGIIYFKKYPSLF